MEVIIYIDDRKREVWQFTMFEFTAILDFYSLQELPPRKRKWRALNHWDRIMKSDNNIDEPDIPLTVAFEVKHKITEQLKVMSWSEYNYSL